MDRIRARKAEKKSAAPPPLPESPEKREAMRAVNRYSALSLPGGLIPIPYADILALTALQMLMLARIARIYRVPFTRSKAKLLVSSMLLAVPQGLSTGYTAAAVGAFPLIKLAPGVGTLAGGVFVAALGASVTFALGIVFIQHFESGGSLLDFDPEREIEHFRRELTQGFDERMKALQAKMPRLPRLPFRRNRQTAPTANPEAPTANPGG